MEISQYIIEVISELDNQEQKEVLIDAVSIVSEVLRGYTMMPGSVLETTVVSAIHIEMMKSVNAFVINTNDLHSSFTNSYREEVFDPKEKWKSLAKDTEESGTVFLAIIEDNNVGFIGVPPTVDLKDLVVGEVATLTSDSITKLHLGYNMDAEQQNAPANRCATSIGRKLGFSFPTMMTGNVIMFNLNEDRLLKSLTEEQFCKIIEASGGV